MREAEDVTKLVNCFLFTSLIKQAFILWQPVELLAQAVNRYESRAACKLRFAKDECEYWDEQINISHAERLCAV